MNLRRITGALLLAALMIVAVCSLADNSHDTIDTAKPIELNTDYSSNLNYLFEKEYYRFSLPAPGAVSISFNHKQFNDANTFWIVKLMDKNKNIYFTRNYDGQYEKNTTCDTGLPAGEYIVYITTGDVFYSKAEYNFRVNYTQSDYYEVEFNGRIELATPIQLNTDYSGALMHNEDTDYYAFTLPDAGCVSVDFSHEFLDYDGYPWFMNIKDQSGELLFNEKYVGSDISARESSRIGLPAGTYYVQVYRDIYNSYSSKTYTIRVNYSETKFREKEFNDNIVSANEIELNTEYAGVSQIERDKDWYRFSIPSPGTVSIRFSHEYADTNSTLWDLDLLNDDNEVYFSAAYQGSELKPRVSNHIGLPEGVYYIRIESAGSGNKYMDYAISVQYEESDSWEKEFNDNPHQANPVRLDMSCSGSLSTNSDEDCYRFDLPAEGCISVTFEHAYIDSEEDFWELQILTDEGEIIDSYLMKANSEKEQVASSALQAGTYYLRIKQTKKYYSSADYTFRITCLGTSPEEPDPGAENTNWFCPQCGNENSTGFCTKCGATKPEEKDSLVCPTCGTVYEPDSGVAFCGICGTYLLQEQDNP